MKIRHSFIFGVQHISLIKLTNNFDTIFFHKRNNVSFIFIFVFYEIYFYTSVTV